MGSFHQRLRREQGDDLGPLESLAKNVGRDLERFAVGQGATVAAEVTKAMKSARLPSESHGYVFWLLVERGDLWPPLQPNLKLALEKAVFLMEQNNSTPRYSGGFEVPDPAFEATVENVIEAAATWANGPLRASILRKYMALLDENKQKAAKALGSTPEDGRARLEAVLLVAVKRHPRWFGHIDLLYWALKPFLR